MRIGCYLTVLSFGLLFYGIENISHSAEDSALAARNAKCVTLTYEQFVKRHPKEGWFHIKGGVLDMTTSAARLVGLKGMVKETGRVESVSIALRSDTNLTDDPARVLVKSESDALRDAWKNVSDVQKNLLGSDDEKNSESSDKKKDEATREAHFSKYIAQHPDQFFIVRDIEGIVKPGDAAASSSDSDGVPNDMAPDYIVLEEGKTGADYKTRSTTNGVLALVAFVVFWGLRILMWLAKAGGRPRGGANGDGPAENPWSSVPQGNQTSGG